MHHARLLSVCALFSALGVMSCDLDPGDPHTPEYTPDPAGKGDHIRDIADPNSPRKAAHKTTVAVTGAVVVAVDNYDETKTGKSSGTIYVADIGSGEPYSGISLFSPSFIPGNLRVSAGDALDLRGEFQENQTLPIAFAKGAFLVQLATPIGTFRFDAQVPAPVDIKIEDLENYDTGRKWLNMIVRVKNVTLQRDAFLAGPDGKPTAPKSGRVSSQLLPEKNDKTACEDPFPKAPTVVNELMDIVPLGLKQGTVIKELVGVVTFFCNLHIAPRTEADIVLR